MSAPWPLVMDVGGRCYFEPEAGGLLLSPADEHPSEPVDAAAEMEDVAWALEMLAEATTLEVRHVRSSWAGLRTFAPDRVPVVGWDARRARLLWLVGQGGAGIKTAPAMAPRSAAIVDDGTWPDRARRPRGRPRGARAGVASDEAASDDGAMIRTVEARSTGRARPARVQPRSRYGASRRLAASPTTRPGSRTMPSTSWRPPSRH